MKVEEFRKVVKSEFGDRLKNATPANVREFLDRVETQLLPEPLSNRIVLDEPCSTYEEVIRDFFAQLLDMPPEEAIIPLWTLSLYLAFAAIESQYADKFATLFQDIE